MGKSGRRVLPGRRSGPQGPTEMPLSNTERMLLEGLISRDREVTAELTRRMESIHRDTQDTLAAIADRLGLKAEEVGMRPDPGRRFFVDSQQWVVRRLEVPDFDAAGMSPPMPGPMPPPEVVPDMVVVEPVQEVPEDDDGDGFGGEGGDEGVEAEPDEQVM